MAFNALANIALRAIPGAFILNSGIGKLGMDEQTAGYVQAEAAKGIPPLGSMEPEQFGKLLSYGEIGVGGALLAPFVPNRLAGLALAGFSAGLLSIYFRDPEKTVADGVRPSGEGTSLAKDSWMMAIAIALIAGGSRKQS
ncbi:hypothetical protein ACPYO6_02160 [Georgenia sp. Z1344]|uniref:hypothetical protein n=1 Tax=Georgenia sp. Z1344 TaxID=3416706 RepID=UPI003CECDAC3